VYDPAGRWRIAPPRIPSSIASKIPGYAVARLDRDIRVRRHPDFLSARDRKFQCRDSDALAIFVSPHGRGIRSSNRNSSLVRAVDCNVDPGFSWNFPFDRGFSGGVFHLVIAPMGLAAGLGAAITGAYYSPLVREKGGWWLTTWGFLIEGLVTLPLGYLGFQDYSLSPQSPGFLTVLGLVAFVVIFGTILSFGLYVAGLKHLPATETGMAASFEPIVASLASYIFLGVRLDPIQYLGGALILVAVVLIAARPARDNVKGVGRAMSEMKSSQANPGRP
jgi:hypothetical protein